jgi:hypothetical protein
MSSTTTPRTAAHDQPRPRRVAPLLTSGTLRGERHGSRADQRLTQPREHREVGVKLNPCEATDAVSQPLAAQSPSATGLASRASRYRWRARLLSTERQALRQLVDRARRASLQRGGHPRCAGCGVEIRDGDSGEWRYVAGCRTCSERRCGRRRRSAGLNMQSADIVRANTP